MSDTSHQAKVRAAIARAKSLTPAARKEIGRKGARARWDKAKEIPKAEYTGELEIGDMVLPCSVLSDGTRILTQSDFMAGMGMYYSGWVSKNRSADDRAADVPLFLAFRTLKPFVDKHLGDLQSITVDYRTERGSIARGVKAETIPKICEVWLDAEESKKLGTRQKQVAQKAKMIMRALAHVGIIALVDEATGFQEFRAQDALAKILRDFIAKELQDYASTFPSDYYREMFRLRGLEYPRDSVKRPQYFGSITNDVVYKRLAPGVLEELKRVTPKLDSGRHKDKLFRRLTANKGYPKLREHLGAVVTMMQLSTSWHDFMAKLDRLRPRLDIASLEKINSLNEGRAADLMPDEAGAAAGDKLNKPLRQLSFEYESDKDTGVGL